jgi:hypothetical protein
MAGLGYLLGGDLVASFAEVFGQEGGVFGNAGDFAEGLALGFFFAVLLAEVVKYGASYDGDDEDDAVLFLLGFASLDLFVGLGVSERILKRGSKVWAHGGRSLLCPRWDVTSIR